MMFTRVKISLIVTWFIVAFFLYQPKLLNAISEALWKNHFSLFVIVSILSLLLFIVMILFSDNKKKAVVIKNQYLLIVVPLLLLIVSQSNNFLSFIYFLIISPSIYLLGRLLLSKYKIIKMHWLYWGVGLLSFEFFILLIGSFHLLYKSSIILFIAVIYILSIFLIGKDDLKHWMESKSTFNLTDLIYFIFYIGILYCYLLVCLQPDFEYDAIVTHLYNSQYFVNNHNLAGYFDDTFSYMISGHNMLFVMGLALKDQYLARLFNFLLLILSVLLINNLFKKITSSTSYHYMSGLLFMTIPLIAWSSVTAYQEAGVYYFSLLAFACFIYWYHEKNKEIFIYMQGVFLGAAITVKYQGGFISVSLFVVFLFFLIFRELSLRQFLRITIINVISAFVILLPWMLRSYYYTANPIFPLVNEVFKSPFWNTTMQQIISNDLGTGVKKNLMNFFKLPWLISYSQKFRGTIGPSLFVFLPILLIKRYTKIDKILYLVILTFLACWFFVAQEIRYMAAILPIVCLAITISIERISIKEIKKASLISLLMIGITSLPFFSPFWLKEYIPHKIEAATLIDAFKVKSDNEFLKKHLRGSLEVYDYINKSLDRQKDKILMLSGEGRFYSEVPMVRAFSIAGVKAFDGNFTSESIYKSLTENKFTHIYIDDNSGSGFQNNMRDPKYFKIVFAKNNVKLYKINEVPNYNTEQYKNLLINSDFSQGLNNWNKSGNPSVIVEKSQDKSVNAIQVSGSNYLDQNIPVKSGELYLLRLTSKGMNESDEGRLQVNWLNEEGKIVDVTITVYKTLQQFKDYDSFVTVPFNAVKADVYINGHNENDKITVYNPIFAKIS